MQTTNKKTFIDATINIFAYSRILIILIAVFIGFLYVTYNYFKILRSDSEIISLTSFLSITISVVFFLIIFFLFLRNHWIFKVITEEKGITFVGFLKKVFIRWDEIMSLGISNNFLMGNLAKGDVGEVKTRERSYYFTFTMKENGKEFPKFSGQIGKFGWKDKHGNKQPINKENCPLYSEIERQMNLRSPVQHA